MTEKKAIKILEDAGYTYKDKEFQIGDDMPNPTAMEALFYLYKECGWTYK